MNKKKISFKILFLAVMATFIAGCGSSGSGGGAGSGPVSLGTAANYAILAKTGVSTIPASVSDRKCWVESGCRVFLNRMVTNS